MDVGDESITSYKAFPDIYGDPLLLLRTESPRRISALGEQALNASLLFLCIVSALIVTLIWMLLRRSIVGPIENLADHMDDIRKTGDLTRTSTLDSRDEIGELARMFDRMTHEVHEARQALLQQTPNAAEIENDYR